METYIVDSFTNEPFKGNPAGVCILDSNLQDNTMQAIAKELGLSETAFLKKIDSRSYSIRFFSPKMEIPLCGHATLASAKVLFEEMSLSEISFFNIQGLDLHVSTNSNEILMKFPVYKTTAAVAPNTLLKALGLTEIKNVEYNAETNILLLEIEDTKILKELKPDYLALKGSTDSINGVLVTAASKEGSFDFHSRYFWPWSGTNEDPVTGGTHTFLAPYWSKRLQKKKMRSFQSSERTGFMDVELIDEETLIIKSQAVVIFKGNLKL